VFRQLTLRYQAASETARIYSHARFNVIYQNVIYQNVIYQDVIIGPMINDVVQMYKGLPLYVIVLCPNVDTIHRREQVRSKTGYADVTVEQLQITLASTPQIGLWIDSSDQTVGETTTAILANRDNTRITFD
jgi:chloramphenicol 3-O-phosphotransferase